MKIRRLFFEIHPILQGLELDFTKEDGSTADTVVIAGGNGLGKTLVLNSIYEFTVSSPNKTAKDEKIDVEFELSSAEFDLMYKSPLVTLSKKPYANYRYKLTIDHRLGHDWNRFKLFEYSDSGVLKEMPNIVIFNDNGDIIFNSIFSDVEINFSPEVIKGVTSLNIDSASVKNTRSNANLATMITQLLIDIQTLDALEFSNWAKNNNGQLIDESRIDVRTKRFTNAFHYMFPVKRYKGISNSENNSKVILFEDGEKEMNISQLSSGEKQIVFRGGFLLKDLGSLQGATVLIDEPEISLHPDWQLKIMPFFQHLFTDSSEKQTSQIIVTTHSPFIIHNSNMIGGKIVVLKKGDDGKVFQVKTPNFYSWSPEKLIKEAFNVSRLYSNEKPVVFVEGETDELYLNKALSVYKETHFEFKWIGRVNDRGAVEFTGDSALNQAKAFFLANPKQLKDKVVLLYDSDTNKPDENFGNLLIRKMSINHENKLFRIGIENLLSMPENFDPKPFYKETIKVDDYGAESIIRGLNKMHLCSYVCGLPDSELVHIMKLLNGEISRLLIELG